MGPTVPLRQEQQGNQNASTGIKQVFPQPGTEGQQDQQGEAKVSTSASAGSNQQSNQSQGDAAKNEGAATNEAPKITPEEEKKIVEDIIKRITPLVEELVASELHRIRHGGQLNDDDDEAGGFMPFPFVIGGGPAGLGVSESIFSTERESFEWNASKFREESQVVLHSFLQNY